MSGPITVLGVDAADWRLIEKWNLTNLKLKNHRTMDSICYSQDYPATLEVWPSIATGVPPEEHGVILDAGERPSRGSLFRTASKLVETLPKPVSQAIISAKEDSVGSTFPQTDHPTIFERGVVLDWPGVTACSDWQAESDEFSNLEAGNIGMKKFEECSVGYLGSHIGWLAGMAEIGMPIAGAHVHYLDYIGHISAKNETQLRQAYTRTDNLVGWLREKTDHLVIISDHGMQTTVTDDPRPGEHSQDAYISTTMEGELPENVLEVRNWLEEKISAESSLKEDEVTEIDAPREHLEALGYLD